MQEAIQYSDDVASIFMNIRQLVQVFDLLERT
jgi:hypothetical protein